MSRLVSPVLVGRDGDGSSGGEVEHGALPGTVAEVECGGQCADDGGHIEVDAAGVGVAPAAEHAPRQRQRVRGPGVGEVVGGDAAPVEAFALGVDGDGVAGAGVGTGEGIEGEPPVRYRQRGGHRGQSRRR